MAARTGWLNLLAYRSPGLDADAYPGAGTIVLRQGRNEIAVPRCEWETLLALVVRARKGYELDDPDDGEGWKDETATTTP